MFEKLKRAFAFMGGNSSRRPKPPKIPKRREPSDEEMGITREMREGRRIEIPEGALSDDFYERPRRRAPEYPEPAPQKSTLKQSLSSLQEPVAPKEPAPEKNFEGNAVTAEILARRAR